MATGHDYLFHRFAQGFVVLIRGGSRGLERIFLMLSVAMVHRDSPLCLPETSACPTTGDANGKIRVECRRLKVAKHLIVTGQSERLALMIA